MRPGPQQRVAAYPQPAWASSTWKLAARVESLSSAGAACTIITKQISTLTAGTSAAHPGRRCDGCTGRRGRQGPHPRARRIEVTRARDPLLGPRRTSSPPTPILAGARRPPRLTGAARNARAHAGQHRSARRVSARAQCRGHPRPLSDPGAAPHFAAVPTRPRRRQGVATAHGRRAQRAGTCRAALERPARACMDSCCVVKITTFYRGGSGMWASNPVES